jgi:hypothetical protein
MLFVDGSRTITWRHEQVQIVLSCVKSGSVSEAHTASDGIIDQKPVLVASSR